MSLWINWLPRKSGEGCSHFLVPRALHNSCEGKHGVRAIEMASAAKRQKIAALCMTIACLDDEGEGIRKKGSDRDWLRRRAERGSYAGIVTDLAAEDLPSFKHYMRMDVNSFRRLVEVISPRIVKKNTRMRSPISPSERLALTLRFLATGETFRSLEFQFRVSRTAISYIVLEVCQAILS